MNVTTITAMPPTITEMFNRALLQRPALTFSDTSKTLMDVYQYIKRKLLKPHSRRGRKKVVPWLEQRFLEIYEQIAAKEAEIGAERMGKRFMYRINVTDRQLSAVFNRLRKY